MMTDSTGTDHLTESLTGGLQSRGRALAIAAASLSVLVIITFSWLVFPYAMNGDSLLFSAGTQVKKEREVRAESLSRFLSRPIEFIGGIEVTTLWATEEYFAKTDRASLTDFYEPSENFIFFVTEEVHTGVLPYGLPRAMLKVGEHYIEPDSVEGPEDVTHHRMTILSFPRFDESGAPYMTGETPDIQLMLYHSWDRQNKVNGVVQPVLSTYMWKLPLNIPLELLAGTGLSLAVMMSLSAGLLSAVLTPCLLQLGVIFLATMGANGAEAVTVRGRFDTGARRRIITHAAAFVIGYVVLFVIAGAAIGLAGKQAQILFSLYARPVSVAAGIVVILFGLWLAVRSNAPVFCRIPGAGLARKMRDRGLIGTVTIAIVYNLGCMTCFGGAIIATLFIYVGALGSAWAGAVMMGVFALGVAVPFMLAAVFFTRVEPLIGLVSEYRRSVGLVSSVVVMLFGVLLLTDNFHTLSDAIYPYLGLS